MAGGSPGSGCTCGHFGLSDSLRKSRNWRTFIQRVATVARLRCVEGVLGQISGNPFNWEQQHTVEPYNRDGIFSLGPFVRHAVISNFPGADEKQKLNAVFSSAPPWLIWFTFADYTAKLLGLKLPDLSDVRVFERSKANFDLGGGCRVAHSKRAYGSAGPDVEPLSRTDLTLFGSVEKGPVDRTQNTA